jgi:two-component system cell cycle sensor histidine kinase/response regulator CckA
MWAQITETPAAANGLYRGADEQTEAETILFVEDERFVREVTGEVLRSAGYRVLTAKNAAEAVCVYDAGRSDVDLLLTDVVLPGETGRALAGRLRRENPGLKVLLVTGYADQMAVPGTKHEECLPKPFSTEILLWRVRQLLDRSRLLAGTEDPLKPACGSV